MTTYDFALVGAGIAGASLAAELAEHGARVLLLEAEDAPGYHATGRSAAFWEECYGGPELVPLTLASGDYLREHGFLTQRGALYIGREDDAPALDAFMERFGSTGATIERLDRPGLEARVKGLRDAWTGAVWEPACADIDVAALHAHYLARAKKAGVTLECRARVSQVESSGDIWTVGCDDGRSFEARILVNAAGAWADGLARMAGANPLGIQPLLRTVAQLRTDPAPDPGQPLVLDIGGKFYFKPRRGGCGSARMTKSPASRATPLRKNCPWPRRSTGLNRWSTGKSRRWSAAGRASGASHPIACRSTVTIRKSKVSAGSRGRAVMASRHHPPPRGLLPSFCSASNATR